MSGEVTMKQMATFFLLVGSLWGIAFGQAAKFLPVPQAYRAQASHEEPANSELLRTPPHCVQDPRGGRTVSLAVALSGRLYFSTPQCVYEVDTGGHYKPRAVLAPVTGGTAYGPGLAADDTGNLFISDFELDQVRKVAADGSITVAAGGGSLDPGDGGPATDARLFHPRGLAVDSVGNLYIGENGKNRIRKVSPDGTITTAATLSKGFTPDRMALDKPGNLYIADNTLIFKLAVNGELTRLAGKPGTPAYSGEGGPAREATLFPSGLAVDADEVVYIADDSNGRILKITPDGTITTVVGEAGCCFSGDQGPASNAKIALPTGVAVDGAGNIYFVDLWDVAPHPKGYSISRQGGRSTSLVIRKISANDGTITTVVGGRGISIWP
jgi:sugar lactone lactonase YvrE